MQVSRAALLAVALLAVLPAYSEVVMVYSVQRHGARNVLPKGRLLEESQLRGGPTLLPQGQRQCFDAGTSFRERYINRATCNITGTCLGGPQGAARSGTQYGLVGADGVGFGNWDVYVRSSALDRTVLSGVSFFTGVFPPVNVPNASHFLPTGAQPVPIYTQADQNDIIARAYSKCPTYQRRLEKWFRSDEFKTREKYTSGLRDQVNALLPSMDTSLTNWWNVYDRFNTWRSFGVGEPVPDISDALFREISGQAMWLETAKMRSSLAGNLLGGVLLADVLDNARAAMAALSTSPPYPYYKLLSLSAHYNTQLGLLAALQMDQHVPAMDATPWFQNIPLLASTLVLELHALRTPPSGSGTVSPPPAAPTSFYVRLAAKDGSNPTVPYRLLPLPCASKEADSAVLGDATSPADAGMGSTHPYACTWESFIKHVDSVKAALSPAQWCDACGEGGSSGVDVCMAREEGAASRREKPWGAWGIALTVIAALACAALLGVIGTRVISEVRRGRGGSGGGMHYMSSDHPRHAVHHPHATLPVMGIAVGGGGVSAGGAVAGRNYQPPLHTLELQQQHAPQQQV